MAEWEFERVAGPFGGTTDGPVWDGDGLLFSVVEENLILRYEPESGAITQFRRYTARNKGLGRDAQGNVYGCQASSRRIVRYQRDGSTIAMATRLDGRFHNFPDDLAIDCQGRIWFSDPLVAEPVSGPQWPPLEHASVLRMGPGPDNAMRIQRMTLDTRSPRGVLLSADEKTLYVAESDQEPGGKRELRSYPIREDGALGPHKVLYAFGGVGRGPNRGIDGMCLDSQGNIIASVGDEDDGPGIFVFSRAGSLLERHLISAEQPTNCAFGDRDLASLYVTTAGGNLYRVRNTGRQGEPPIT